MANGSYSAGSLYLGINAEATDTLKTLDAVIGRLTTFNRLVGKTSNAKGTKSSFLNFGNGKNSLSSFFNIGKWTAVLYVGRRLGRVMADIVTKGSDFGETLNLWQVAMGDEFLPQATEFVNKLNEAYGISKETLMNSQAIFKNMLGSLGQISSAQAYQLSEGITQMALDYASLYNVKFEDAMTKFQAALAGQVRPIRSVAGYDITENTLFQLYQTLGGTKTMRQLSRTEKQLLAIYAVFEQMDRSGAVGDLDRTINSFANQSRVMADSWKDVQTYAGLTVTRLLEQYDVMHYVNAVLIFMSRIFEGLANSLDKGLGESGDVFGDMENSVTDTTEAVEGLQTALLDFDKFRALDQTNTVGEQLGVDETILNAMTRYDSILENANLSARQLADEWLKALGFVDENNDGIIDFQKKIDNLTWENAGKGFTEAIANAFNMADKWLSTIDWGGMGEDLSDFINGADWADMIVSGVSFVKSLAMGIAEATYTALLKLDWLKLIMEILEGIIRSLASEFLSVFFTSTTHAPVTLELYEGFQGIIDELADAINIMKEIWVGNKSIQEEFLGNDNWFFKITRKIFGYADGGLPDKGTMFVAGEAGAEMVYNMPSGQSGVANVRQIEQAMYNALSRYGQQDGGTIVVQAYLDGEKVYENTTARAKAQGKVWAKA